MDNYFVTTPIYYVNGEPHIGSAYTTILADVLAGYHRLFGGETYFLTGSDEHGQKVEAAAKKNNLDPLAYCDQMVDKFKKAWVNLEISNDDFIRTTDQRHKTVVQKILQEIYDKGEIYSDEYEGWYCVHEERFWTEKDIVDGNCPDCNRPVSKITEKNYFFKMSKYRDWLIGYIHDNPGFIQPDFRRNEVLGFLKQPLGDLCISRPKSRLTWGIELPFDTDFVCYVWFDALINYISAIGYHEDDTKFKKWWPAVHLIGKDILTTHAVYWPCMLKAMGVEQPKTIFAHGFWLSGETKMSKSFGN
ncbi:MAG: class I tRNA ligase family protein, partial [candidate division Zixibacteria bacterium]